MNFHHKVDKQVFGEAYGEKTKNKTEESSAFAGGGQFFSAGDLLCGVGGASIGGQYQQASMGGAVSKKAEPTSDLFPSQGSGSRGQGDGGDLFGRENDGFFAKNDGK